MMWWNGDWSWAGWLAMTVSMLAFWGLVIWAVLAIVRGSGDRPGAVDPERTLAERFARGDISVEEFHDRLETLRSARGPGSKAGSSR